MAIYVDADACPVKQEVVRGAERHSLIVYMVSNSLMRLPQSHLVKRILVSDGFDAADKWILENAKKGDLVITSDIPLAADCIKHQAYVITPTGHHFDEQNIGNARAMRDLNGYLRETGVILDQKRSFSKLDRSSFLQKMEEVLQCLKRV